MSLNDMSLLAWVGVHDPMLPLSTAMAVSPHAAIVSIALQDVPGAPFSALGQPNMLCQAEPQL